MPAAILDIAKLDINQLNTGPLRVISPSADYYLINIGDEVPNNQYAKGFLTADSGTIKFLKPNGDEVIAGPFIAGIQYGVVFSKILSGGTSVGPFTIFL